VFNLTADPTIQEKLPIRPLNLTAIWPFRENCRSGHSGKTANPAIHKKLPIRPLNLTADSGFHGKLPIRPLILTADSGF
jgi:hypothetical protein